MPRTSEVQSLLTSIKQQTSKALASLQGEITKREQELAVLKAAEARWKDVIGEQPRAATLAASSQAPMTRKRPRLDWDAVLARLPATFDAKEVKQRTGKPMEQVYAGVSRWVKDNKVRKNPEGGYQKMVGTSSQQRESAASARRKAA